MSNCTFIDLAQFRSGGALNDLIAKEWLGWHRRSIAWYNREGRQMHLRISDHWGLRAWSPSTNPTHASEARNHGSHEWTLSAGAKAVSLRLNIDGCEYHGVCKFTETNGDKGQTEALATCRAIVAALKAVEATVVSQ